MPIMSAMANAAAVVVVTVRNSTGRSSEEGAPIVPATAMEDSRLRSCPNATLGEGIERGNRAADLSGARCRFASLVVPQGRPRPSCAIAKGQRVDNICTYRIDLADCGLIRATSRRLKE